jgi:hypothetical protein
MTAPEGSNNAKSASFVAAQNMLPPELHPLFERMLEEYKFVALETHGAQFVSPKVIAKLILLGWRQEKVPDHN